MLKLTLFIKKCNANNRLIVRVKEIKRIILVEIFQDLEKDVIY